MRFVSIVFIVSLSGARQPCFEPWTFELGRLTLDLRLLSSAAGEKINTIVHLFLCMFWSTGCISACFILGLKLQGTPGRRLGLPGGSFGPSGATWAPSRRLGGATAQGKRTHDKTWCALVMVVSHLLIFHLFYQVFSKRHE